MTDVAAAQLRRILALVPELADDEEHPIEALAQRLGTDRHTLLADLRSLTDRYDDPAGFAEEGVALFIDEECVSLTSSHFRRPMRLTVAELRALELGLAMLEGERPPEEHRAIAAARARLQQVIAKLPSADDDTPRHASLGVTGSAVHLRSVREALREGRKLRMRYRKADAREGTTRTVCPYALVVASGTWYAVAFCEESEGVRVFRLDRVEGAEVMTDEYDVPESFSLERVIREGRVLVGEAPKAMRVRYSPRIARWIAEREGREPDADGSLILEHPLMDVEWGVRHVLQYGADAEVLEPGVVREEIGRRLARMMTEGAR